MFQRGKCSYGNTNSINVKRFLNFERRWIHLFFLKNKKEYQDKSAQDLIPIKMIDDGKFVTSDDRLVQIMKVSSINIQLKSKSELQTLLGNYEVFLKSINFPIQIQIVSMPVDLKNYISGMESKFRDTKDINRRALLQSYIDYCKDMESSRQIMMRQRYVIFDEKITGTTEKEYEEAVAEIKQKSETIVTGFKDMDLTCEPVDNVELVRLFQVFFNYEASLQHTIDPLYLRKFTTGQIVETQKQGIRVLRPSKEVR